MINAFDDAAAVAAWQRAATTRATFMSGPTKRMLELAAIARGHRVLVLGTGMGEEALDVAAKVGTTGEVIATDVSPAMVATALRTVADAGAVNVRCLVMDGQRLAFGDATFDAAVARNALMFIPDLGLALSDVNRVLKPGGRLAATVWAAAFLNPRLAEPLAATRTLGAREPRTSTLRTALRLGSPSRLLKLMNDAGFSETVVERWPVVARYSSVDEAVRQAMDHAGTREMVRLLGQTGADRMRRSLTRRWQKYAVGEEAHLPGEQLVVAGTSPPRWEGGPQRRLGRNNPRAK
jgi:ubiquinone/menaquinone biosynthesis C-methylase UbiE